MKDLVRYIRLGSGMKLSKLGERLGLEWLMYNPIVYEHFHEGAAQAAPHLAGAVLAEFPGTTSLVDVGCGSGAMAAEFQRRSLRVVGLEYSPKGRAWAAKQNVRAYPFDLASPHQPLPPDMPYDLALSTEVAEHLPDSLAQPMVDYMCKLQPKGIIFTAAHPGQGGTGHINEQPQSYWIPRFESRGYRHDPDRSQRVAATIRAATTISPFLADNMMIFVPAT
jgi:SAM-dependent methyltransferase